MASNEERKGPLPLWRSVLRDEFLSAPDETEGLRERKKRLMRQLISNTATMMFLERGFDNVKITEPADLIRITAALEDEE